MNNEQENPLVSVIIPTYERPDMLGRAIDSVLNQTYDNIEIIVVDDNDKNSAYRKETKEFIKEYKNLNNILYLEHDINRGACAARNTGIINSTGDYIAFLDDDDLWKKNKLEKQIKKVLDEKCGLVYTGTEEFNLKYNHRKYNYAKKPSNLNKLFSSNFIGSTSTVLVNKKLVNKVSGFDENFKSCQDWDLWLRLMLKGANICCIEDPLVSYYIHNRDRISDNKTNNLKGHEQFLKKHKDYLMRNDNKIISNYFNYLAGVYRFFYDVQNARYYYIKSLKFNILNFKSYINLLSVLFGKKMLKLIHKLKKNIVNY